MTTELEDVMASFYAVDCNFKCSPELYLFALNFNRIPNLEFAVNGFASSSQ